MGALRILIAEDNQLNFFITQKFLTGFGVSADKIAHASNGVEAIEVWSQGHFDLVLMDLQMPVMDGLDATREIRRLEESTRTPIVALSAAAFESDRRQAFDAGCNGFLSKPLQKSELEELIVDLIQKKRAA